MELSIIIPLLNESESIEELHQWIHASLSNHNYDFEIIYVDDGSTDNSWEVIERLVQQNKNTQGIRFQKNFGKSQALHAGFKLAAGDYVMTMDADLQDSPEEIHPMITTLKEKNLDILSGWKKKRYDSIFFKNIPSKLFNWAARRVSGIKLHDFNCGIKAYKREVIKTIEVYGEMHRYIPVIAAHQGFDKIEEQIVQHQARQHGKTKFGADRFVKGFLDLITLWFVNGFGKRPMHFFGFWGTLMLFMGFCFTIYLGIDKLYLHTQARLITQRPEFYIALTTMILGTQLFIAGFLGEILVRYKKDIKRYIISKSIKNKA
ncbi:glycosyltransferase family 2 protein [Flavobacteriaceae bacterium]|nr:glycosyltransferase family 2 protein [bacterium]MDA9035893.1 glycosyltransferase family 2 protein [Flavobacteriaceae bacterium]MDA9250593.1 glycosyltransferase family 2 protein [Flavobacteriaceae bacterium]|tara:strand:- start:1343 stop:2296 length:954 start_codon:yes stop_codon:yes gene_type:complete